MCSATLYIMVLKSAIDNIGVLSYNIRGKILFLRSFILIVPLTIILSQKKSTVYGVDSKSLLPTKNERKILMTNLYEIDEYEWKKRFSSKMNTLLAEKKASINRVANEIGVDAKTIRSYTEGKSVPSALITCKLAEYFGVSTDFLIADVPKNNGYTDNTIIELANLVKLFHTKVTVNDAEDTVIMHINDKILTSVIAELYYNRNRSDYDSVAATLANAYGRLKIHNGNLVDYLTFEKLIRHKFIYQGLEDDCYDCVDENGNDCIAVDDWNAYDEIQRREQKWDDMTAHDRELWWSDFCKSQQNNK